MNCKSERMGNKLSDTNDLKDAASLDEQGRYKRYQFSSDLLTLRYFTAATYLKT